MLLRHVWVWLHYAVLSTPRRGGPCLNPERLSLKDLLLRIAPAPPSALMKTATGLRFWGRACRW